MITQPEPFLTTPSQTSQVILPHQPLSKTVENEKYEPRKPPKTRKTSRGPGQNAGFSPHEQPLSLFVLRGGSQKRDDVRCYTHRQSNHRLLQGFLVLPALKSSKHRKNVSKNAMIYRATYLRYLLVAQTMPRVALQKCPF